MVSRFSRTAVGAFELVFRPWMRRRVHSVKMTGLPARAWPTTRPLLLASNHVSWWDGFILREMQRVLRPEAPMYTVMSRIELARFPFFRLMGVVGIEPGSTESIAGALRFLETRLRERPESVVVFFPQGRIWPSHRRPLGFRRGVELFARQLSPVVLPVGLHVEPMNTVAPTFFVSVGEPLDGAPRADELERRVEAELDAMLDLLAVHGEDALEAWPAVHDRLCTGRDAVREVR